MIPAKTQANENIYGGNGNARWCGGCSMPSNNTQYTYYQTPVYVPAPTPIYVPAPVYVNPAPAPTPIVYSSTANKNLVKTAPKTIAKAKTPVPKTPVIEEEETPEDSGLTANAVSGANSFLPSGIIQWIFFAILILLIVILTRKIYGGNEKYQATPMKHD